MTTLVLFENQYKLSIESKNNDTYLCFGDIKIKMLTPEDAKIMDVEQLELYTESKDKLYGLISATLYYEEFCDEVDGDGVLLQLIDTIFYRLLTNEKLCAKYYIEDCYIYNDTKTRVKNLPTTGSELADIDFNKLLDELYQ